MYRFHRTADMLADFARVLTFAADELRDAARAASVSDDRACAAIDHADMLQRQLDSLTGAKPCPTLTPTPGPLPHPECRDDGPTPTAPDEGLPAATLPDDVPPPAPAADIPPLDAAPAPSPGPAARTRRGRGRKGEGSGDGEGSGSGQAPAPDAATDAEAVEQVAQALGDAPAPRDVTNDLFGGPPVAADPGDDFLPL